MPDRAALVVSGINDGACRQLEKLLLDIANQRREFSRIARSTDSLSKQRIAAEEIIAEQKTGGTRRVPWSEKHPQLGVPDCVVSFMVKPLRWFVVLLRK